MNDLDQIKEILFGNEKKALNALVRRLETPESRTADVADVLPDAVTRSYARDPRLGKALSQPIESTLSEAIRREPKKFADALFPIMGPAIRKAIAEALKSLVQSMNNAIETSWSPTAQFKAWRSGVSIAEWGLRKSLVFRVDEVYLIAPTSGLLISHLHHPDIENKDEDAVSAMLTAIQDFVSDSFTKGAGGGLDSVVIGEFTVWISQGPHAMLACVMRGVPPAKLKAEVAAVNERVHLRYAEKLSHFHGEENEIAELDVELEDLLKTQRREKQGKGGKMSLPLIVKILLLGALLALTYFMIRGFVVNKQLDKLDMQLSQTAGVITTRIERDGGRISVHGLRDPLALELESVARSVEVNPQKVDFDFRPFQSLEPAIVEQRARQILQAPQSVNLRLENNTLRASGNSSVEWRNKLLNLAPALVGINNVDVSELRGDDQALEKQLIERLKPPPSATISVTQGVAIFSGSAPKLWHQTLVGVKQLVPGIVDVNTQSLVVAEQARISVLLTELHNRAIYYQDGIIVMPDQELKLIETAKLLREYQELGSALNLDVRVQTVGYVDGTGSDNLNQVLSVRRANDYRDRLIRLGVDAQKISISTSMPKNSSERNPNLRKAELRILDTKN